MFKKLKDKLAEEVKSSPQRIQQFAQAAQAAVTSASSSISDITNNDLFSIGDNDNPQSSAPRLSPQKQPNLFQDVSLTQLPSELVDHSQEMDNPRQRRLSNSSFASDISFRLPSYETPSTYHLQSDFEVSASEADERGLSGGPATLDRVTKEQLYSAYKRTQERYTKYRNQYGDLARHYKLLERENAKARSVLVETQDKALRRISELKEQCTLEQSAKAHLEKALRIEIEEKNMKIQTLNTKVNLLQNTDNSNSTEETENDAPLISLATENVAKPTIVEPPMSPLPTEVTTLNNKIEKMEQLLNKYKDSLKMAKDKNSHITAEMQILSNEIEIKSKQIEDLQTTEELLSEANKKIKELNDANEELQNKVNAFDFTKSKELSTLEVDLQKAKEEIKDLRKKIEIFTKREEENAISLAENKLGIHKELESKEAEIKSLKDALSASKQEVQSLRIVVDGYQNSMRALEEDKTKLSKDCSELATTKVRIDEMNSQLQELSKKCQSLEQLKSKADEEHKCHQLQLKQETAEKLAMIDRNVYLESRNTQLSDENSKKSAQITKLENELQVLSKDRVDASAKDESEVTNLLNELNLWKEKCETLESEIQEEREELVKLQAEIEKLLANHESIQSQNVEYRVTIANLTSTNSELQESSNEYRSKMILIQKTMLQETKKMRKFISLTASETRTLLSNNQESVRASAETIDNVFKNSVESLALKLKETSAKFDKLTKDYEEIQSELVASHAANSETSTEKMILEKNLAEISKKLVTEKSVLKGELTNKLNDYEQALEDLKSAINKNKTLQTEKEMNQVLLLSLEVDKKELNEIISGLKDKLKKINEDFSNVSQKHDDAVNTLKSMRMEIEELKSSNTMESEAYHKIQENLESEKTTHALKTEQIRQLTIDNNHLKEKVTNLENNNIQLIADLDISSKKYTELQELVTKSDQSVEMEKERFEKEKKNLSDAIKAAEINHSKILSEMEHLKQVNLMSEDNINKLNSDILFKSEDCDHKLIQINELEAKVLLLSEENIILKSNVSNFNSNIENLESEINEIKISHAEIELEKDRLNNVIEHLESKEAATYIKNTQTDHKAFVESSSNIVGNAAMFENKWVLENKESAMVNTSPLNLKTNAQEDIVEHYTALKINYDALKDDNRRLHSDIEGLQSYLTKISKENSVLNDKLREVMASCEHSIDNDQLSNINEFKLQLDSGKEKINDLLRENSLLIEENLELKDQINSQSYAKPPEIATIINNNQKENANIKEKYDGLLQTSSELKKRNMDLEQINNTTSSNISQLQEKNEKLKRSNEKLERRLDEALVSLRHLHSLTENTELEYLRNILYEYLTGTGTHSVTLAKVLAAIVKFDDMQTQIVMQKEKERQGFDPITMNMFVGTSKEKFFYHNTLLCLVKALQGKNITVDLRNDSYICGFIDSVDGYMNISFTNAVYCDPQGNEFSFENLFLQSRNIRYVHVPEEMSMLSTIRHELGYNRVQEPKKPVQKSRKAKKAFQQHMQTVALLDT